MEAISYSTVRQNLANTMDLVCDNQAPIIITRRQSRSVVMLSLEEFNSLKETAYLLQSPKNARRLLDSIAELNNGGGIEKELIGE